MVATLLPTASYCDWVTPPSASIVLVTRPWASYSVRVTSVRGPVGVVSDCRWSELIAVGVVGVGGRVAQGIDLPGQVARPVVLERHCSGTAVHRGLVAWRVVRVAGDVPPARIRRGESGCRAKS